MGSDVLSYEAFDTRRFPQSLYLEIAAETGLAGVVVFTGIIGVMLFSFGTAYRRFKKLGDRKSANLVFSFAIGFAGYLLTSVF